MFIPLFDYLLGDATAEEAGTGAGMLNAVQQFTNAIGVAALGTAFFARVGRPSTHSYFAAAKLVFAVCAALTFSPCCLSPSCPGTRGGLSTERGHRGGVRPWLPPSAEADRLMALIETRLGQGDGGVRRVPGRRRRGGEPARR
ncbi:hypothetical protein ADK38_38090 [Streptomyces varsoviensis]|uniref:Major facilitator superfamily (MFS) profile domain-containing protein n=1 Tax=Streptomyces varsoviensis TaxID=67373 RepID=A0ABR5IVK7_9ACTN|nr:hypothetical protein ADK38_38090 [Streptomyces varsoviensis]